MISVHTPHFEPRFSLNIALEERRLVLLTGYAGAGKTNLLRAVAAGLPAADRSHLAAIVNEIGGASTKVDLERLQAEMGKIGIDGCACCTANSKVLEAVSEYTAQRKLCLIEQSGLSRTGELARSLSYAGFRPLIIAAVNPRQLHSARRYIVPHIRSADFVAITGTRSESTEAEMLTVLISEISQDRREQPHIMLLPEATTPLPDPLWKALEKRTDFVQRLAAQAGLGRKYETFEGLETERLRDVGNFNELELILYAGATKEQVLSTLRGMTNADRSPLAIIRAKGVLAGQDIDLILEDGELKLAATPRTTASLAFDGEDYLIVRSLDPRLRTAPIIGQLARGLGTPDCSVEAALAVASHYPSQADMQEKLLSEGTIAALYGADSLLWELSGILRGFSEIGDQTRKLQLARAVATLAHQFLKTRCELADVLASEPAKRSPQHAEWEFNAFFVGARVLVDPQLGRLVESQPRLAGLAEGLWTRQPIKRMLSALAALNQLSINGNPDLAESEQQWLKLYFNIGIKRGEISSDEAHALLDAVEATATKTKNFMWQAGVTDIRTSMQH